MFRPIARHPKFTTDNPDWDGCSLADFYDLQTQSIYDLPKVPLEGVDGAGLPIYLEKGGEDVPNEIRGQRTFRDCSSTKVCTEWFHSEPASAESQCGINDPPGETTSGNWLVIGGSVDQQGAFYRRTLTYVYSAVPWLAFLYTV